MTEAGGATSMAERDQGTDVENDALSPHGRAESGIDADPGATAGASGAGRSGSMIQISPKWQMVLIGGVFIAINIMVMVIFLVVIFLRR